ncbi:CGNR zinc finger domain-containing protein [Actinoplanes sp. TBRC 11911]|uniref:CGNR zinc finger domain-containing protein n=1 Tax=Actinoplanes sp. TBRC 11911 TaxID=2729386 RepID=UPI00145F8ACC|nr:CGNR zinc finger domain-containing protein [Actinoplanes sp. TBRC 11911]NMO55329.1 CGNR zinc finger domain-containing protein [Actinoplanes sp. TBRC 11911]
MTTSAPLLGEPLPVELMNTIWADRAGPHDALSTPSGTAEWLEAIGSRLPELAPEDLDDLRRRLLPLRDALLQLAAKATDDTRWVTPDASSVRRAVDEVNAAVIPRAPQLAWAADHPVTEHLRAPSDPAAAVVSHFAEDAVALFGTGESSRLRVCDGPDCGLYFVKNHPRREWCSPACGNRVRAARHYRRHRA